MPKVSVIIPNYNQSKFVKDAIVSVLKQGRPADEIIVVDDGSTDDSHEVVSEFGETVRYVWQENQGLAGARNTGIQSSTGDLIGLLDADDEWAPDYLETMVRLAEENPDAAVLYCMARCMDVNRNDLPQFVGGPPLDPQALYQQLLRQNFIIPSTVLLRRKTIVEAGSFDANLRSCEDWDLWLRLLPSRKLIGSPKSLVRYRVHGSSLSTNVDGMHAATKKVIEKHFGEDDGGPSAWSPEKRRAYGGVYRYQCITLVQRQENWKACVPLLQKAFRADPSLAFDLNFFYELALGTQPVGYRGATEVHGFEQTAAQLERLLRLTFAAGDMASVRKDSFGTAYHAMGLVSYNSGNRPLFRRYFVRALAYRLRLILAPGLMASYLKSFLPKEFLEGVKKIIRQPL